jgi:tripartite-type tricarboxylate transporter receptor subunit TctC
MERITRRGALLGAALTLPALHAAAQQDYPNRPVRVVIGFAAGGATDIMARLLSTRLSERLGQPFVIENRPGAGTLIAADLVARAAPDGYTLMYCSSSTIVTPLINRGATLDPPRDFAAVSLAQSSPMLLAANVDVPVRTLDDIAALARKEPGKLNISHPGRGGINELSVVMWTNRAGIELTRVPFNGNQPSLNALMRGDVQLASDSPFATKALIEAGKIRPIAVTSAKRSPIFPDVPSFAETLPGYDVPFWSGFVAPARTPPAILDRLHGELEVILKMPDVIERIRSFGAEPVGGPREVFQQTIAQDWQRFAAVVAESGIRAD